MEYEKIEGYVRCLLESWALHEDGEERVVWETLHDLLMAVSRYELMSAAEKDMTTKLCKKLQFHFETKFSLKERKRKAKKEIFPPNPLLKEKQKKEKEQNKRESVCDAVSGSDDDFKKSREAFRQQCLAYVGKYDNKRLADFFRHYSQKSQTTGKMMFEAEEYWTLDSRLELWMNNRHTADIAAASERLKKTRGKRAKDAEAEGKSRELAAQREEANARREQEREESKAGAVTMEEYIRKNPNSTLAKKFGGSAQGPQNLSESDSKSKENHEREKI